MKRIGQLLKSYRRIEDITLEALSKDIGIELYTLQRLEKGMPCNGLTLIKVQMWMVAQ
jgi:cytoskeletal protein RodZ